MVLLLPLISATLAPADADFKVIDVERNEVFAGKLGRRVETALTVEKDGRRYRVQLSRSHTACTRNAKEFATGDMVSSAAFGWGTQIRKID